MTSTHVVGTKADAGKLTALFFEGTKKTVVEVKLLPQQAYFAAAFPEYLDYCIVACETNGIFPVVPIKLPLVKSEWAPVREGDTVLVVQHPIPTDPADSAQRDSDVDTEVKRFEEILRRRDDVFFMKASGTHRTAGCPVFNDQSELVGLQSQLRTEGEGVVNRVVSIVTIVKHLFANAQLSKLQQKPLFQDVWDTWYIAGDSTRVVSIMANFKNRELLRQSAEKLCEHTAKRDLVEGVVACGGTAVIISSIRQFKDDEPLASLGLRALWNISFAESDNKFQIIEANGPEAVLDAMELYPANEDIAQFGVVLLFNLTSPKDTSPYPWASRAAKTVLEAMKHFANVEVLQKFGVGLLANIVSADLSCAKDVLALGAIDHIAQLANEKQQNLFLMENVVQLTSILSRSKKDDQLALAPMVVPIINIMRKYHTNQSVLLNGNNALWALGADPRNRLILLQHPDTSTVFQSSLGALQGAIKN
jgi:hypothetical protein